MAIRFLASKYPAAIYISMACATSAPSETVSREGAEAITSAILANSS
jgi:hypothetical protein